MSSTTMGKFTYNFIEQTSKNFLEGKHYEFKPDVRKEKIIIQEKDCEAVEAPAAVDDGFDEILAEILAEEEAAKQKLDEDVAYKNKGTKAKKGGQKKKKKVVQEDL